MSRSRKPSQLRTKSPDITATTVVDRSFPLRDQEVLSLHCAWSFWCYHFVPFSGHAITLRQKFKSFLTRPGDNDEKISNCSSTPKLVQAHDSAVSLTIFLPCLTTIRGESQVDARNFATVLRDTCQPYVLRGGRKGGPKTAKPHRNTPKNRKPHQIFSRIPKPRVHVGHNMKADVSKTCDIFW